ncbi:hypothetical protein DPMN_027880 [Dreissena polymorpha]|uniref:Uncharacterized protein n=1 Tax=Dreissena polymorpha TaxID=45954 RepID=A0A9D4LV76_DREPO|nr:hypothetical protein DPMN_027880 [Dreissena polymorpha]
MTVYPDTECVQVSSRTSPYDLVSRYRVSSDAQQQPCVNDEISSITSVEQKLEIRETAHIVFHFIVP